MTIDVTQSSLSLGFPEGWLEEKPILSADLASESQHWKALDLELLINS
jgi:exopolyphosphatase/guanosine-5'-triphosphate,3'-diphosphate pyrophosphatase